MKEVSFEWERKRRSFYLECRVKRWKRSSVVGSDFPSTHCFTQVFRTDILDERDRYFVRVLSFVIEGILLCHLEDRYRATSFRSFVLLELSNKVDWMTSNGWACDWKLLSGQRFSFSSLINSDLSMSKKFRCGRLLLTRDGQLKKLDLGKGGGTRTCEWKNDRMTFDEVHKQLRSVFSFSKRVSIVTSSLLIVLSF